MAVEEIIALALGLLKAGGSIFEIVQQMLADGRKDSTPEELVKIREHQKQVEQNLADAVTRYEEEERQKGDADV